MNISPATPPYEFQSSSIIKESPKVEFNETSTTNNHQNRASMALSPPELLLDTSEEDEDIDQNGLLWSVRQRLSITKFGRTTMRLSIPQKRVRPMRIQIPRPQWSIPIISDPEEEEEDDDDEEEWYSGVRPILPTPTSRHLIQKKTYKRKVSNTSSGRPTRVKGPCQACQETSDGCMRKAFNWPFTTNLTFNDKGKPFVYLCNKCGLRYNKSGGCVCRNCRWVLCKEEKRKAMQLIHLMRSRRPDGKIDPDENIENFTCTPKYWSCCHPWKVGWILNSNLDEEDDDDTFH